MEVQVLGCSGAEFPAHRPSSFLLNDRLLFDTGNLTNVLDIRRQRKIDHIFITHSHLDHIMGIPFLADNLIFRKKAHRVNILSIPAVIKTIRKSLLDGAIWPDFTVLPNRHAAILNLVELRPGHPIRRHGCTITSYPVSHSVPATGYLVEDEKGRRFLYTGDTGPTGVIWKKLGGKQLHCLIIETSFPNRMEEIAIRTGHLTPRLLGKELQKMENEPEKIFVTHLKPPYFNTIRKELQKLNIKNLRLLRDGETIHI